MTKEIESGEKNLLEQGTVLMPKYDGNGLVTAIVQECETGEILMLAHMNEDALNKTIASGFAHFWSRSRQELWKKGETSGNTLIVQEIRIDCDQDAILLRVNLSGDGACHTGRFSCFYRSIEKSGDGIQLVQLNDRAD